MRVRRRLACPVLSPEVTGRDVAGLTARDRLTVQEAAGRGVLCPLGMKEVALAFIRRPDGGRRALALADYPGLLRSGDGHASSHAGCGDDRSGLDDEAAREQPAATRRRTASHACPNPRGARAHTCSSR